MTMIMAARLAALRRSPGSFSISCTAALLAGRVDDGQVTIGPVRDFDFHPDEDDVRVFVAEPGSVQRFSSDVYVSAARYGDVVLWHYAFARHWFKINLTTSLDGRIVETGSLPGRVPLSQVPLLSAESRTALRLPCRPR